MMMFMDVFSLKIIIINELLVEFSADENMYRSACAALSAHISAHWHFVQVSLFNWWKLSAQHPRRIPGPRRGWARQILMKGLDLRRQRLQVSNVRSLRKSQRVKMCLFKSAFFQHLFAHVSAPGCFCGIIIIIIILSNLSILSILSNNTFFCHGSQFICWTWTFASPREGNLFKVTKRWVDDANAILYLWVCDASCTVTPPKLPVEIVSQRHPASKLC